MQVEWKIAKADGPLKGEMQVPPDKSISHRAIMFGSIASGECRVRNFLLGEDCMRTLEAFQAMGVDITQDGSTVTVKGKGLKGLTPPSGPLYLGNSGTTMRIISGILAGQDFGVTLTGDESLSKRPMGRIIEPLAQMGARIKPIEGVDHAPLKIEAREGPLVPLSYKTPVASAQVKSCLLAAGLYADGTTSVTEPFQSRDHTERMLEYFSADITRRGLTAEIGGLKELVPKDIDVPGDISSAAFFMLGALIVEGASLIIRGVGLNPTRIGVINVLKRMGAAIDILDTREGLEPVGDLKIRHSSLKGTIINEDEIPLLIDEVPVIAVAAAMAEGETVITGIAELKVKETDRVSSVAENLTRMGVKLTERNNSLIIHGGAGKLKAAELESFGDHRTAMSMAIAALVSDGDCTIKDTDCVNTSYPGFLEDLERIK